MKHHKGGKIIFYITILFIFIIFYNANCLNIYQYDENKANASIIDYMDLSNLKNYSIFNSGIFSMNSENDDLYLTAFNSVFIINKKSLIKTKDIFFQKYFFVGIEDVFIDSITNRDNQIFLKLNNSGKFYICKILDDFKTILDFYSFNNNVILENQYDLEFNGTDGNLYTICINDLDYNEYGIYSIVLDETEDCYSLGEMLGNSIITDCDQIKNINIYKNFLFISITNYVSSWIEPQIIQVDLSNGNEIKRIKPNYIDYKDIGDIYYDGVFLWSIMKHKDGEIHLVKLKLL